MLAIGMTTGQPVQSCTPTVSTVKQVEWTSLALWWTGTATNAHMLCVPLLSVQLEQAGLSVVKKSLRQSFFRRLDLLLGKAPFRGTCARSRDRSPAVLSTIGINMSIWCTTPVWKTTLLFGPQESGGEACTILLKEGRPSKASWSTPKNRNACRLAEKAMNLGIQSSSQKLSVGLTPPCKDLVCKAA